MRLHSSTLLLFLALIFSLVFAFLGIIKANYSSHHSITAPISRAESLPRSVFVHLFEWKWKDIERECVEFLGPKGFSAVQVSPPNEHMDHRFLPPDFPWWVRYQPVSYQLSSRSGSRSEFINMVKTCKAVGVDIYVDAIINHMARDTVNVGTAGSTYNKATFTYPFYSYNDFNHCEPSEIQNSDYQNNAYRVRHCELAGLPDLNQDSAYVQGKIVAYLQDLVDIGVAGFRFDAGKHMEPYNIDSIVKALRGSPYIFLEVIDLGGEAVSKYDYNFGTVDVTEFLYSQKIGNTFAYEKLSYLSNFGEPWGMMPSLSAVVFVDNHDNQRGHGSGAAVTYRSGFLYDLTNIFMLAWPYGYPKIMSSYEWGGVNDNLGPPSDAAGNTLNVYNDDGSLNCFGSMWKCEHRWRPIANMVQFRNYVIGTEAYYVSNWWSNGNNQIAFSRSGKQGVSGFVAINKENFPLTFKSFYTGLPDGNYCDVVSGEYNESTKACTGKVLVIKNGGYLDLNVEAFYAIAIHSARMT